MKAVRVKRESPLNITDRMVYSAVRFHHRKSISRIAMLCKIDRKTALSAARRLIEFGLLQRDGKRYAPLQPAPEHGMSWFVSRRNGKQELCYIALPDVQLKATARYILGAVANIVKGGKTIRSKKAVARLVGVDSRTASRQIDGLLDAGLLVFGKHGYEPVLPKSEKPTQKPAPTVQPVAAQEPPSVPPALAAPPVPPVREVPPALIEFTLPGHNVGNVADYQQANNKEYQRLLRFGVDREIARNVVEKLSAGVTNFTLYHEFIDQVKENCVMNAKYNPNYDEKPGRLLNKLFGQSGGYVTPKMYRDQQKYRATGGRPRHYAEDDEDDE